MPSFSPVHASWNTSQLMCSCWRGHMGWKLSRQGRIAVRKLPPCAQLHYIVKVPQGPLAWMPMPGADCMCTAFKSFSASLCQSLVDVAKRLCSSYIDPSTVSPLLACRLIALNKCPGVRPIGIGDMARRIIAKCVLVVVRGDIQDAAGSLQLCAGQISGYEAAVHSVREGFQEESAAISDLPLSSLTAPQWTGWDAPYLLRSSIQCIRGARSSIGQFAKAVSPVDLVTADTNFLSC